MLQQIKEDSLLRVTVRVNWSSCSLRAASSRAWQSISCMSAARCAAACCAIRADGVIFCQIFCFFASKRSCSKQVQQKMLTKKSTVLQMDWYIARAVFLSSHAVVKLTISQPPYENFVTNSYHCIISFSLSEYSLILISSIIVSKLRRWR